MKHEPANRARFQEWIRAYGIKALARELELDPSAVSRWAKGENQPNLGHAAKILKLAKGKLRAADLVLEKGGAR